jgi:hypothetical protein
MGKFVIHFKMKQILPVLPSALRLRQRPMTPFIPTRKHAPANEEVLGSCTV